MPKKKTKQAGTASPAPAKDVNYSETMKVHPAVTLKHMQDLQYVDDLKKYNAYKSAIAEGSSNPDYHKSRWTQARVDLNEYTYVNPVVKNRNAESVKSFKPAQVFTQAGADETKIDTLSSVQQERFHQGLKMFERDWNVLKSYREEKIHEKPKKKEAK